LNDRRHSTLPRESEARRQQLAQRHFERAQIFADAKMKIEVARIDALEFKLQAFRARYRASSLHNRSCCKSLLGSLQLYRPDNTPDNA
jgi:hypothetical protein